MAWVTMTYLDTTAKQPIEYDVLFNTDRITKITPNANRVSSTLHYNDGQTAIIMHSLQDTQEKLRHLDNQTHWVDNSKPKVASVSNVGPLNPEPAPKTVVQTKAKGTTSGALE